LQNTPITKSVGKQTETSARTGRSRIFAYSLYRPMRNFIWVGFLASFLFLVLAIWFAIHGTSEYFAGAVYLLFMAFLFSYAVIGPTILKSDIVVDDDGISWVNFGKTLRAIPWKKIKRIRVRSYTDFIKNYPKRSTTIQFIIDQTEKPKPFFMKDGKLVFDDWIDDLDQLRAIVNFQIREHQIEVLDYRGSSVRRIESL
jgi:hypothetical protein